jgi:hypothetical protein
LVITLKIFVSSPGDVGLERGICQRVLNRMELEFRGLVQLEPIFWEFEPLRATGHFQPQIPRASESDLCIFLMWARFGSPLPPDVVTRPDGSPYLSGTEYEFEDAVTSYAARKTPDIFVYRKRATPPDAARRWEEFRQQYDLVESFFKRWFRYDNGSFKSAFYEFDEPARFETMLEPHMRKWIQEELQARGVADAEILSRAPWKGSPFRGLEAFSVDDGLIFCGRTQATTELLALLHQRAKADSLVPFVLLSGASGTGKSSLVRAGLLPLLSAPHVVEGIAAWRYAIARPSTDGHDPLSSLATALMAEKALPELARPEFDAVRLAAFFAELPEEIAPATVDVLGNMFDMAMAASGKTEPSRLLIIVDQLEELFTNDSIGAASRLQFLRVLNTLVRTGRCWVIATVRADFYPRLVALGPVFCDLCPREAVFELRPPNASEITDIIRRPAALAGLEYERRHGGAEGLDDVLRDAAAKNPDTLSLLEFALEELYQSLAPGGRILSFEAYNEIGGLEGALEKRADAVLAALPQAAQDNLPVVLSLLTRFDLQTGATSQRRVSYDLLAADAGRRILVDHFTDKRLFVRGTDDQGTPTIGVVHEALLLRWKRSLEWSEANRRFLRWRAGIVAAEGVWREQGTPDGHLIVSGNNLKEAAEVLSAREAELGEPEKAYIRASIAAARKSSIRLKTMVAAAAILVVAFIGAAAWYYDAQARVFVTYFDDWEHRWGVAIGNRPVAPDTIGARLATVKLEHRGRNGPLIRMTYIGPDGGCGGSNNIEQPMLEDENADLGARRQPCSVDFNHVGSTLTTETFRDRAGFELFTVVYQPLRWITDNDGRKKPMLWASLQADGITRPLKTGASDIRYILVPDGPFAGMIEREEYFNSAGEPRPNTAGNYGYKHEWFRPEFGHATTNLGEDGKPRHGADDQVTTTRWLSQTDSRGGRTLTITRFDAAGERAARKSGEWKTVRITDPHGLRVEVRSFEINERPLGSTRPPPPPLLDRTKTPSVSPVATTRYSWGVGPDGIVETRRYFDPADNPVDNEDGIARLEIRYDRAGREVDRRLFDTSAQPVEARDGVHHRSTGFDRDGSTTLFLNVNKNGKPSPRRPSGGGTRMVRTYDPTTDKLKSGQEIYVDELGRPKPSAGKVARTELRYDERENRIERRLYGADNKLVTGRDCWAIERVTFDGFGRAVEYRYYDAAEKPVSPIAPYLLLGAISRAQYDSRGQRLSTSYWDEEGQPIQEPRGVARLVDLYDEQGRRWQRSHFDANNRLTMNALVNYAMQTIAFNENGQRTVVEYTDKAGRLVDNFSLADRTDGTDSILVPSHDCGTPPARHSGDQPGFARTTYRYQGTRMIEMVERKANGEAIRYNYDAEEREIEKSYLDGNDVLRMSEELGYAVLKQGFDSAGRLIFVAAYNTTGQRTIRKYDGFAEAHISYQPDGSESYELFGPEGEPIEVPSDKGGWTRLTLRPRDARGERRGVYGFLNGRIAAAFLDDRGQQMNRPNGLRSCIQSPNERMSCFFAAVGDKPSRREWHDVIVDEVAPDSAWALAGLRPGDAIRGLDRAPFGIFDELVYQLRASPDAPHSLHIRRGDSTAIVQIKAGKLDDIRLRLQISPVN